MKNHIRGSYTPEKNKLPPPPPKRGLSGTRPSDCSATSPTKCAGCNVPMQETSLYYVGGENGDEPLCAPCMCDVLLAYRMKVRKKTMKYRKKPVVIEAVQWNATATVWKDIMALGLKEWTPGEMGSGTFSITTLEGDHLVRYGDWIIKDVAGEFYPCRNDIFIKTYEPAE